jgi:hypothetical protein
MDASAARFDGFEHGAILGRVHYLLPAFGEQRAVRIVKGLDSGSSHVATVTGLPHTGQAISR